MSDDMPLDPLAVLNARQFVEKVLRTEPRIKLTGAGCFMVVNECDIDLEIDGAPYHLVLTPRQMRKP